MRKSESSPTLPFSAWPHRVAVILCCATFPLIWVGGLVTTYDAGMAVPDWPTTFGYNLLAYPWKTWLFGPFDLFIEHGHRLLGALVGLLAILLVFTVVKFDRRASMQYGAVVMLGLVITQGVLGGLRVRLDERGVAMIHACFGLATFAFAAAMATFTSRSWLRVESGKCHHAGGTRLLRLAVLTVAITYLQVVFGALLRHIPVGAGPGVFRAAVLLHIVFAMAVAVHVLLLFVRSRKNDLCGLFVRRRISLLSLLVLAQIALGASTWVMRYGWPAWFANRSFAAHFTVQANSLGQAMITTMHMAIGALILSLSVVVALRLARPRTVAAEDAGPLLQPAMKDGDSTLVDCERATIAFLAARNSLVPAAAEFAS